MKLRELFVADVTRDIPPVVYFHEQSPAKLQAEVSEYIVTCSEHDEASPASGAGVHEQLVRLLRNIERELQKAGGPELPACWISGFYGSGKSSFAKLLGLSLDGVVLPDGTSLWAALEQRDLSRNRRELTEAWAKLAERIDTLAAVFDIGAVARDGEPLHTAALRVVQARLGYCSTSHWVADFELRLERDGEWSAFERAAREALGKAWSDAKHEQQAEAHFAHALHRLKPERYPQPTSWLEGRRSEPSGGSVRETVEALEAMLEFRAPERTLFIVVDEVSHYVQGDENRVLKLQSFVSELGQRLKGRVWLLATGQQRLEQIEEHTHLGKLQDRFPPHLRVHLDATNVRDVVNQRLLGKTPAGTKKLEALLARGSNRANLKLYGFGADKVDTEEFTRCYPLLPGHVELLLELTSRLRSRSRDAQGHAVRGILQLLGELFREHGFAERELGSLVTFDAIFDIQSGALEADVRRAVASVVAEALANGDALSPRVVKVVALLELISDQRPTSAELVAACLYATLGDGNPLGPVNAALEKLRAKGLLAYSEKRGFKLQSAKGHEWQRERDDIAVSAEQLSTTLRTALSALVTAHCERPRHKGRSFGWALGFGEGRTTPTTKQKETRDEPTVGVDFRFVPSLSARDPKAWVPLSASREFSNRLLCVVGEGPELERLAREHVRSERMLSRYRPRRESLTVGESRVLVEEELRFEELTARLREAISECCIEGSVYFRGQQLRLREAANDFGTAFSLVVTRVLPDLYPHLSEVAITARELEQLLEKELTAPSPKFMEDGLGLLTRDGGRYIPTCGGVFPTRIVEELALRRRVSGEALVATFMNPPYGCTAELVKACCAALLRAKKVRIQSGQNAEIIAHTDPGVRDLFESDREFRRAEFIPALETEVTGKDRIALRKLFQRHLQIEQDPDDEALADTVFRAFPGVKERLRELEGRVRALPGRSALSDDPALPAILERFRHALEDCGRSRHVDAIVVALKRNLDALREGFARLEALEAESSQHPPSLLETAESVARGQAATVELECHLHGRELETREQLDALLAELEERVAPVLAGKKRVRLL